MVAPGFAGAGWHTVKEFDKDYIREQLRRVGFPGPEMINPNALESQGRVVFLRVVPIAEFDCAPKDADRVVVGFLAPGGIIGNFDKSRVSDIEESLGTDPRTPESVQDPSVRCERDACHVVSGHSRGTVGEEGIEDLGASFR